MVPLQAGDAEALGRAQLLKASLSGQLGNTRPLLQVGPSIFPSKANCCSQYVLSCRVYRQRLYLPLPSLCQQLCFPGHALLAFC